MSNKFSTKPGDSDVTPSSKECIGIDLGTTNSCFTYIDENKNTVIIPNHLGHRTTPSVVLYENKGGILSVTVGNPARRKSALNPKNYIFAVKRMMGKKYTLEDAKDVLGSYYNASRPWQDQLKDFFPYSVVDHQGRMAIRLDNGVIKRPEEVSAEILSYGKQCAEKKRGCTVKYAVITVPAYFNDDQRQATITAAEIAGLKVLRLLNEPTAAALAYKTDAKKNEHILVFDLGGGTFDVSLLHVEDGVFEVIAVSGDTHLGGEDFDNIIMNYTLDQKVSAGDSYVVLKDAVKTLNDSDRSTVMQRLKTLAEESKIALSSSMSTEITASFLMSYNIPATGQTVPINLDMTLSREEFKNMCEKAKMFERCANCVNDVLKAAGIKKEEAKNKISCMLAVGGMTRMPYVAEYIQKTYGITLNCTINPDEVVAEGASVQSGILCKEIEGIILLDVTPLSLGIETLGGAFTVIIPKNSTIPTEKSQVFSTAADNQTEVQINIAQGERPLFRDNHGLGMFSLGGIAPAPRGVPQIEVKLSLDANGILSVSAKDLTTGKEASITINNKNISQEEIDRLIKEHQENKEKDAILKRQLELRNDSTFLIDSVEKSLKEYEASLPEDIKESTRLLIQELNDLLAVADFNNEEVEKKLNDLREQSMKIGQHVYGQKQGNPDQSPNPSEAA